MTRGNSRDPRWQAAIVACALYLSFCAPAALHVHEPFDYPGTSILAGVPAMGFGLQGTDLGAEAPLGFELRVTAPGMSSADVAAIPGP